MAFRAWHEPALLLGAALGPPADAVVQLAQTLGVDLGADDGSMLAVAKIEDEVSRVTGVHPPRPCTPRQAAFLGEFGVAVEPGLTVRTASALIQTAIFAERLRALHVVRPTRGDRLIRAADPVFDRIGEIVEISSVDRLGQVWVKGAGGSPARPQDLART